MKLIRVFPRRTNMTPDDSYVFIGDPPMELWRPEADQVHVSCLFTWDKDKAIRLAEAWNQYYGVRLSGPALESATDEFTPGLYVKHGVTFTSRGCNNNCPWCLVPEREGKLKEIKDFAPGHIINDNNLLQCSHDHIDRVFAMLRTQRRAEFTGGLDARLIDDYVVNQLLSIKVYQLFLAADTKAALNPLREAVRLLEDAGFKRQQIRCYVLIGYDGESIGAAADRLESVWRVGCIPFAQLFQPPDEWIEYPPEWKRLTRLYSRPAATKAMHRG